MRILVQKFGGTSLATNETREQAIEHMQDALQKGYAVVVVVSAMGRKGSPYATDTLLSLVSSTQNSSRRELDLLMSCGEIISAVLLAAEMREKGLQVEVLTGGQAGILTSDQFSSAQIMALRPDRVLEELGEGKIVIVTGFQGMTEDGDITTLGRGGSDTTATALGVALNAEMVDIFTDVEGIMTADPRIVEDAKMLHTVTFTEICNLAYQGAKVIHPRAVEIAMQKNIPIRVRSTMSKEEGTLVTSLAHLQQIELKPNDRVLTGITQTTNITQIQIDTTNHSKGALAIFQAMADHGISVDFISVSLAGVAYTVSNYDVDQAVGILRNLGFQPNLRRDCAKISAVGAGIAGVPGVMAHIVEALTEENIEILQSADSHTTIWCLVPQSDMTRAVRALHRKFEL